MSSQRDYCEKIPYRLPSNPHLAIATLAQRLSLPPPAGQGDGLNLLKAMCGTMLYRHLPQKERGAVMALIRQQEPRVAGRLADIALQSTFITATWHPATMSTREVEKALGFHDTVQRQMGLFGLNPGAVGTALYGWKLIKESASSGNLLAFLTSLGIFAAGEFSNAELTQMRNEIDNRRTVANEHAAY